MKLKEFFIIKKNYKYSATELENMIPFEYDILLLLIQEDIKKELEKENLRRQRRNG